MMAALQADGFANVELFALHAEPSGDFPNVPDHVSNPENAAVFESIIEHGRQTGAGLALATDPDCDRMGCAAPQTKDPAGPWCTFTGNQLGALLADYVLELIRQWGELGVDAVFLTDDWGSQTALMISPDMWRSFFKPHYRRLFAEVHRWHMDVVFHSCGNVLDLVEDLIEVGIDVLDPVQPGAMDQEELVRRFRGAGD